MENSFSLLQRVLPYHAGDKAIALIVPPAAVAHETVVDEHLLVSDVAAIGPAPIEHLLVVLTGEHLRSGVLIANRQIAAGASVESLSKHVMVILREFAVGVQTNLGTHAGKIEQASGLFVAAFESL